MGLIPVANARFFDDMPATVSTFLHNGVVLGVVTAVVLNLILNRSVGRFTAMATSDVEPVKAD